MAKPVKFKATIQAAGGGGAFVLFPFDVKEYFGKTGRIQVKATFNGEPYKGSMVKYGMPQHMLVVLKETREKINKQPGDEIEVIVSEDNTERVLEVPEDLQKVLEKHKLQQAFDKFSYTHKKEWVKSVTDAKRPETREKRLNALIEALKAKKTS